MPALVEPMAGSEVQKQIRMTDQVVRSTSKELVTAGGGAIGSSLLASASGLRGGTLFDVARFAVTIEQCDTTPSLLVTSHTGKNWSLREVLAVLGWPRRCSDGGIKIVLAGLDQSVRGQNVESVSLNEYEARLRLTVATHQMRMMGFKMDVLASPKQVMSLETMNVLLELGFRVATDRNRVRDLTTDAVGPACVLAIGRGLGDAGW